MLLDEFWFGFWEYWHGEKFGLGLYDKLLWVCAWIYLWRWANFVGMKFWLVEKFCWVCDVDSWRICVVMILAIREIICACTCGNFYLGHVGTFLFAWLWKNVVIVYRYVKKFDCGEILVGHWSFVVVGHWLWEYFFCMDFLVTCVLFMEIDKLNFYVAESQELRQSPNVEKCMGTIVS